MSLVTDIAHIFTEVRPFLGGALCLIGGILAIIGAIGVLRFPDFYTRLHAASVTDTGAVLAILLGMAFLSPHWLIMVKLLTIGVFLFLTGPTSTHAVANAAHTAGLEPIIGHLGTGDDNEHENDGEELG
jgi:multicomponent Na+:H+ antiporter subunit G